MSQKIIHMTKDRVQVSYDRKFNLGNYESLGISTGYSTDVKKGESLKEAWERCDKEATQKFEALCEPVEKMISEKQAPKPKGKKRWRK